MLFVVFAAGESYPSTVGTRLSLILHALSSVRCYSDWREYVVYSHIYLLPRKTDDVIASWAYDLSDEPNSTFLASFSPKLSYMCMLFILQSTRTGSRHHKQTIVIFYKTDLSHPRSQIHM